MLALQEKKKVSAIVVDNNYMHTCESQVGSFMALGMGGHCYILVECSARHELGGYDSDALHVVLEACTSDTL